MAWADASVRVCAPRIAQFFSIFVFALACVTSYASAQTVSPQTVEFNPSADHGRSVNGVNVVDRYELRFYAAGGSAALQVIDFGKPAPAADGVIRYNFSSRLGTWMVSGTVYEARVAAVGPGGSTLSAISNQFTFLVATPSPAPCVYTIATASRSGGAGTTTGTLGVTAGSGCAWTAGSDADWLDITGGVSGSGNGTVSYLVDANPSTAQRIGRLTIAGKTFSFTQAGAPCAYSLSPASRSVTTAATSGSVGVTAGTGCAWTAASSGSWLTVSSGGRGSGNGTIGYNVAANTLPSARTATISVGTASFSVTQSGSCSYVLSPTTQTVTAAATTGSVTVTAASGCSRTASSSASWLTVTAGATGSGNGTVNYSIAANSSSAARSATLTVGSATLTVTQSGGCSYTVSPTSRSFNASSATGSVTVAAAAGCSWTATRSGTWITISSGASGSGNGTVSFGIAAQTGTSSRTGTLTVGGQAVTITQAGAGVPATPAGLRITSVTR